MNDKDTIKQNAKREVIKEIEKLYGDLDFELDCCQGCMGDGPDVYLEMLNVYKDLLKYLDENYVLKTDKLFTEARNRINKGN